MFKCDPTTMNFDCLDACDVQQCCLDQILFGKEQFLFRHPVIKGQLKMIVFCYAECPISQIDIQVLPISYSMGIVTYYITFRVVIFQYHNPLDLVRVNSLLVGFDKIA